MNYIENVVHRKHAVMNTWFHAMNTWFHVMYTWFHVMNTWFHVMYTWFHVMKVSVNFSHIHGETCKRLAKITVFYNHFCTNNRTFMSFFRTLDTKLKTVIICNTGRPMFKTLHIAFISLEKPCIYRSIGSKYYSNLLWNIIGTLL